MARATPDVLRTLAFGAISGTYSTVGSPLAFCWSIQSFINTTDADMFFSIDGVNDNYIAPAASGDVFDLSGNAAPTRVNDNMLVPIGTQFYVRYNSAPSKGAIYIGGIYAAGG